jgi:uncharacterized protein YwgA
MPAFVENRSNIKQRDVILAIVGAVGGREDFGRTSLQKVSYLTSLMLNLDLGHRAYYYGPYSTTVESDSEALALAGLIEENSVTMGISAKGYPVVKYTYTLSEEGRARLRRVELAHPEQFRAITSFVSRIEETVGSFDQNTLSAVAKSFYIAKEQDRPVTADEIQEFAKELGWTLKPRKIEEVTHMLADLGLVQIK